MIKQLLLERACVDRDQKMQTLLLLGETQRSFVSSFGVLNARTTSNKSCLTGPCSCALCLFGVVRAKSKNQKPNHKAQSTKCQLLNAELRWIAPLKATGKAKERRALCAMGVCVLRTLRRWLLAIHRPISHSYVAMCACPLCDEASLLIDVSRAIETT
jgi:hypothetical protein